MSPHNRNALVYSGDFDRKELQSSFFFRFGLPRGWKDKKRLSEEQFKALFHFLNRRDTFVCLETGDEKTLIYHTAVLVARKVKILPSNSLVVVVSPLNALIADQRESCQRLKLKAVEMERKLFDNADTLNRRSSKMPKCFTAVQKPWKTSDSELVGLIAQPINLGSIGLSMFV